MQNNEEKEYFISKINTKNFFKVYKSSHKGNDYFKILIQQKNHDGTIKKYYKQVSFKKTLKTPNDSDLIRIKQAIENYYGDDVYNPRSAIMIVDYELKQTQEQIENDAFDEYNSTISENDEIVNIDDSFLE